MRCLILALSLTSLAVAADPPKDTVAAAYTKAKKLKAPVTLSVKDVPLKDALKELSAQLEDAKLGPLDVRYAAGLPSDAKVTYSAKDVPAEVVLDSLLRPLDMGFKVVSKDKDRYDGWVDVVKGANATKPELPTPIDPEDEKLAQSQLELAKKLLAEDKAERAKTLLTFVVKKYPGTKAAKEAKALLEKK